MPDLTTVTGVVATPPRHITTNNGLEITSFRLASGQRRFDREKQKWVEADTNWYTVTAFRQLALNLATSIDRGQHVLVSGRLRIRPWENGEKSGTSIEIEADAVGHDLGWGTSVFTRSVGGSGAGDGGQGESAPSDGGWAPSAPDDASPSQEAVQEADAHAQLVPF